MPGVAFVTGASYGIGQACALALARDGFHVAVSELDPKNLADTVAKITATGSRALPVALDLRSQPSIEGAMTEVLAGFGQLDVNLKGTFFMSQQMGRHLVATRRGGSIISVASTHGVIGFPMRAADGISKAGISHMTRMLAIEWAEHGIRVNAIAPGTVETPTRKAFLGAYITGQTLLLDGGLTAY